VLAGDRVELGVELREALVLVEQGDDDGKQHELQIRN
jgi:hypothetical protein